jgi:hypothetical protein
MIDGIGKDAADQRDVIHAASGMWKQFADVRTAAAMAGEFEHGRGDGQT